MVGWPRGLLRRLSQEVELVRAQRVEEGTDTVWDFDQPEPIYAFIRPPETSDAADFSIEGMGVEDTRYHLMDVLEMGDRSLDAAVSQQYIVEPPMEADDRIITSNEKFRVVDPVFTQHTGFARYALKTDGRGEDADSTDSDDSPYTIS